MLWFLVTAHLNALFLQSKMVPLKWEVLSLKRQFQGSYHPSWWPFTTRIAGKRMKRQGSIGIAVERCILTQLSCIAHQKKW